ncbi:MAG: phosphatase PAP2 family protein [Rariglobus sp.]
MSDALPSTPKTSTSATPPWWRVVPSRWISLFWLKAIGTPLFMVVFFIAYFAVLRASAGRAVEVPLTFIDHWVGFQAWSLIPYLSLWLYVSLPSSLIVNFWEIARHTLGCALLSGAGLFFFWLWPTTTPSPDIDWQNHPEFLFIKQVDAGGNACPSLHVAFAVFAAFWLARLLRRIGAGPCARIGNVIWAGLIIFSTLATHQHVAIDVVAGALLGWLFARINLHFSPEPTEPDRFRKQPSRTEAR